MKMDRSVVRVLRYDDENDDDYVEGDISSRFEMVNEITDDIIALQGHGNAESGLQRDVVNIIKK